MSRIHKEHLQAGYIFGDTINQEYIYLPSYTGVVMFEVVKRRGL